MRLTAKRLAVTLAACVVACAAVAMLAPLVGVTLEHRLEILPPSAFDPASPLHELVAVRLPRVLAALLLGAALSGAGCALQALLRNPLAEPFTLGISSGSSLAAVLAIQLGLAGWGVNAAALVGAIGTLVIVARLARVGRQLPPATLVLAGVTISMVCSSISVMIQCTADFADGNRILSWMVGGFDSARIADVQLVAIPIGVALLGLIASARSLDALAAGPELAASLGVAVGRTQAIVFGLASLLVGLAVAVAGPIGFVGLVVPHAMRAVVGPDHRVLLPASMLGGGALLVTCDTLARTVLPTHLPAGAVTAVLGGLFFLGILVARKRKASL
ncbi:MAG TPA: iron ABC transporter permease [Kofleriaceae bacterium]|nr:iron ABC transporter permease [Kofleriaceae bacterium]